MDSDADLRFCTLNCKGLLDATKRSKLIFFLDVNKIDIAFLQETYCTLKHKYSFELASKRFEFIHNFSSRHKSAGTVILIRKSAKIKISEIDKFGVDGRTLSCNVTRGGRVIRFVSVYAPSPLN